MFSSSHLTFLLAHWTPYWREELCYELAIWGLLGGSAQLIISGLWGNVILITRSRKFIGEGILSELAIQG